jgi:hypothetical protein
MEQLRVSTVVNAYTVDQTCKDMNLKLPFPGHCPKGGEISNILDKNDLMLAFEARLGVFSLIEPP